MAFLLGRNNPTQSCICNLIILLMSIVALSHFTVCDARSSLSIFRLRKGLKFSYHDPEVDDSLDLPTLDAYDFGPSLVAFPPLGHDDNSLLAPSPMPQAPISSPPEIAQNPYGSTSQISHPPSNQPSPAHSDPFGPHNRPTKPPSMQPTGAPRHNWAPDYAVWCVARPTVPEPMLQKAMDYACGNGADCGSIKPNGPCFVPNTLVAHASYAFNSYWQRTKILGGTCDFGGNAMLITVDPSSSACHFTYL